MAEYIDKQAVINRIKEYALEVYGIDLDDAKQFAGGSLVENYSEGLYEAKELVEDIPTADVAPVVRCKDCIYARNLYGRLVCKYACSGYILREGFFCADGTRKETRKDGDDNAVD